MYLWQSNNFHTLRVSWKNSSFFFWWETIRCTENADHRKQIRSYKKRWFASFQPGRNSIADESAWLTFPAIDLLADWLKPDHRVFEYGGGGSTLFFCNRAGFVATVEHDEGWFKVLSAKIREKGHLNWEGSFVAGEDLSTPAQTDISDPAQYRSGATVFENYTFEKYAKAVKHYDLASFDLILVDGRARPACIQEALPYLKPGGLLILDNAERPYYTAAFKHIFAEQFTTLLNQQFPCPYAPGFTLTLILQKNHP